jgi:hypothetical protein
MRNINLNPNNTHIKSISLDTGCTWDSNIFSFPLLLFLYLQLRPLVLLRKKKVISDIPT